MGMFEEAVASNPNHSAGSARTQLKAGNAYLLCSGSYASFRPAKKQKAGKSSISRMVSKERACPLRATEQSPDWAIRITSNLMLGVRLGAAICVVVCPKNALSASVPSIMPSTFIIEPTKTKNLGCERLLDIVPVCSGCHESIHQLQKPTGLPLWQATTQTRRKFRKGVRRKRPA
jgi:hypothetical protein